MAHAGPFPGWALTVCSPQIARLEQTWVTLRQRHTEGAILYEKKLKPFLKSLNEGKGTSPTLLCDLGQLQPVWADDDRSSAQANLFGLPFCTRQP